MCAALGIAPPTLYLAMDRGDLPYVKFGRARRVREEDVLAFVERSTVRRQV